MHAPTALHVVEGGDHSLVVSKTALKAQGATQEQADAQMLAVISSFLNGLSPKGTLPRPQSG
jgi:uncharacterized protein